MRLCRIFLPKALRFIITLAWGFIKNNCVHSFDCNVRRFCQNKSLNNNHKYRFIYCFCELPEISHTMGMATFILHLFIVRGKHWVSTNNTMCNFCRVYKWKFFLVWPSGPDHPPNVNTNIYRQTDAPCSPSFSISATAAQSFFLL